MGGGGSIGMMNATIKNNRKLLNKRKSLKEIYKSKPRREKVEFDFPIATSRQLNDIKLRIQSERRERNIIIILVFGLVFSSAIVLLQFIL